MSRSHVQILAINFFNLLKSLIKCVQYRVRDDLNGLYPKSIFSDWNGFFSKEIFDPVLCLFVKYANKYSQIASYTACLKIDSLTKLLIKQLSQSVALIPFERLLFNELDAKFNVLDLDNLSVGGKLSVINLTDPLKTVINHLVPLLKHQLKSIQICAYKVLRCLMKKMDNYYSIPDGKFGNDNNEENNSVNKGDNLFFLAQD
jgi:hypothetical protein